MTMHDINLASIYSDNLLFMKQGENCGYEGSEIVTEQLIGDVYGVDVNLIDYGGIDW